MDSAILMRSLKFTCKHFSPAENKLYQPFLSQIGRQVDNTHYHQTLTRF